MWFYASGGFEHLSIQSSSRSVMILDISLFCLLESAHFKVHST